MKALRTIETFRLIIELPNSDELENLLEFIGRSLDNGVLKATFTWRAEGVSYVTDEGESDE